MNSEKIEILSLGLFNGLAREMEVVQSIQRRFKTGLGWHYYLDLAWLVQVMGGLKKGSTILDAGAGVGLAQIILVELGYNVISADFANRQFPRDILKRYSGNIFYLNDQKEEFNTDYTRHLEENFNIDIKSRGAGVVSSVLSSVRNTISGVGITQGSIRDESEGVIDFIERNKLPIKEAEAERDFSVLKENPEENCGTIFIYKCNLKDLKLLGDETIDGVVSVSALEHNEEDDFTLCMDELLRVTKPGGKLAVTVCASLAEDWFHKPSRGWCYSEATIKRLFRLPDNVWSNFSEKEELFEELRKEGNALHERLAPIYYKSGDNGMPWGKWKPEYQPLGVVKVKGD